MTNPNEEMREEPPLEYMPQIYMPKPREDITKWRLEAADVITRIEHHIKGEFLVKKEEHTGEGMLMYEEWESFPQAKIMNETGAKTLITSIEIIVNKVAFLSNISDDDIYELCRHTHHALAREVYDNWDRFDVIRNPGPIITEIMNLIFLGLKRAQGAGEREAIGKAESVIRQIREGSKSGGGFPFIGKGRSNE